MAKRFANPNPIVTIIRINLSQLRENLNRILTKHIGQVVTISIAIQNKIKKFSEAKSIFILR